MTLWRKKIPWHEKTPGSPEKKNDRRSVKKARQKDHEVPGKQSGILPYRIESGKLHILFITNRSGKKWIIPKGKIEPGMTALSSAEK